MSKAHADFPTGSRSDRAWPGYSKTHRIIYGLLDRQATCFYIICIYEHIDMEAKIKAEILKILGDPTRLRVAHLLVASPKSLCVCEIVDALKLLQYRVSKSLVMLRRAGLVDVDRNGTWGYYRPKTEDETNRVLFDFVKEYCSGEPFDADLAGLSKRLVLREGEKCVVGFLPEKELQKLLRKKGVAA